MQSPHNNKISRLVIAGGGTAGWITAAVMAKTLGDTVDITLVESDAIPTVGVGEATIPPLINLHGVLGIDENEFVARTQATFKLGIAFENWRVPGEKYFHSFGFAGQDCWACGFQHFWLAGKQQGVAKEYERYCPETRAAAEGRFSAKALNYAYHLDAGLYARFLREFAEKLGVTRVEGKIQHVDLQPDTGHIRSLQLEKGTEVEGDFFVDCTGFRGLLIEKTLRSGFEDWSHWLPCDSAFAVQSASVGKIVPFTRSIAHASGWQWRIPLQHRRGNGLVFSRDFISDDAARALLVDNVEGELLAEPRQLHFRAGVRRRQWLKNCVAIGLSSGFLEPLESTSIHLIQRSAIRLAQLFPVHGVHECEADEFNAQAYNDYEKIRDFIILHYKVTDRTDSEFWRYCRSMSIPESLERRIALFRRTGKIFKEPSELFSEESWRQVMMGQGIEPESYHPIVDTMPGENLKHFLSSLEQDTVRKVQSLPDHETYIAQHCAAEK